MKSVIVYWSQTGNTKSIAEKIAADTNADIFEVNSADVDKVLEYDNIILGCPAMGAEEIEDTEFRPFYELLMSKIKNQRVFLFGSYGWGDGEWMRSFEAETKGYNANLIGSGLIVNGDASEIEEYKYLDFIQSINS